jgi:hypothetical protein
VNSNSSDKEENPSNNKNIFETNKSPNEENKIVNNNNLSSTEVINTSSKFKNSTKVLVKTTSNKKESNPISLNNFEDMNIVKNNNSNSSKTLVNEENTNNALINKVVFDELIKDSKKIAEGAIVNIDESKMNESSLSLQSKEEDDEKEDLLEAIKDEKEDLTTEDLESFKRWSLASNIAPVYFNSLGQGSAIHEQFNTNSKTGEINMSYGLTASYAISKKLSVRTGVNQVNLGYNTNDVVIYENVGGLSSTPTPVSQSIRNIDLNNFGDNLSLISANTFSLAVVPESLSNNLKASLNQKLGFIEVPLELEYKVLDKKFGINVIGGFSALFLNNNEVYSVLEGESTLLGKATNINSTSYSANLGLGLDYKISKKLDLNLEPVFKYQINTFNNTSGDFRPYFIGIYSGLKFKF